MSIYLHIHTYKYNYTYIQSGKKLREHRFLACLEGKYSDSVKLYVTYVSPDSCHAITNAYRTGIPTTSVMPSRRTPSPV